MLKELFVRLKRFMFVSGQVTVGQRFRIGMMSYVWASVGLKIGDDVYIGKFCSIQCNGRIGNGVLIANNVGIVGRRDHDTRAIGTPIRLAPWIGDADYLMRDPKNQVDIGDDVWIGFGAIILSGITIGRGAIISAGAVVRSDVPAYAVVAGNPAGPVAMRFTSEEIEAHEKELRQRYPV